VTGKPFQRLAVPRGLKASTPPERSPTWRRTTTDATGVLGFIVVFGSGSLDSRGGRRSGCLGHRDTPGLIAPDELGTAARGTTRA